jgi:hypothetical protein
MKVEPSTTLERNDARETTEPQLGAREICENACGTTKSILH